jgi:hypothetical protein
LPKAIINRRNIYALLTTHGCLRKKSLQITRTGIGITDSQEVQIENILTELELAAKSEGIHLNVTLLIKTVQQVSAIIQ